MFPISNFCYKEFPMKKKVISLLTAAVLLSALLMQSCQSPSPTPTPDASSARESTVEIPSDLPTDTPTDIPTDAPTKETDEVTTAHTHSFGEWEVVKPAAVGVAGLKKRTCSGCSETETREIPAITLKFSSKSVVGTNSFPTYIAFNSVAKADCLIPGLDEGMVPQGMDVWAEKGLLLISGYFPDTKAHPCSVLLAVDLAGGGIVGEYDLKNASGGYYTGHAGGVAVAGKNLYISDGGKLHRIPLSAFDAAGVQGDLTIVESISVPVRASFCNYSGGYLWVGDFYYGTSYPTDDFRHMTNREGKEYCAWSVGYKLDPTTESGIADSARKAGNAYATPDVILSIDQKIQGFAVVGDKIALSQSYGRKNNSKIYLYDNVLTTEAHTTVELNGAKVPLWFLDGKVKSKSYTAPPMSEGLAAYDGKLLILFESGADKYRNDGGKNPTDRVWKLDPK